MLNIDLANLLAAEEAERHQRLEEGYESEDSLEGDEEEDDDDDHEPLDPEFSHHITELSNLPDFDLPDLPEEITFEYCGLIDGQLPNLTDSEEDVPSSNKSINSKRKASKKLYKKNARNNKRIRTSDGPYSKEIGRRRVDASEVRTLDLDAVDLPVTTTGYQGIRATKQYGGWKREKVLRKLHYIDWDGE